MKRNNSAVRILCESAIMVALATVLSLIKVYEAPYGGSVTLISMAPIIILSLRRGVKVGLAGGFVYSVIQLLLGLENVGWVPDAMGIFLCIVLDYIVPFTLLGLAGMFRNVQFTKSKTTNIILAAILGTVLVCLLRYFCHILSGVVVWYALDLEWYADDPEHIVNRFGAWAFSAIYNGSFMLPESIITVVATPLIDVALDKAKI